MRKQDERDGSIGEGGGGSGGTAGSGSTAGSDGSGETAGRIGALAGHGDDGGRIGAPADDGDGEAALAGIELDAWAPPAAPPAGALADAVIAQVRQPAGAPALEAIELDAPASGHGRGPGRDRGGRRWPIALAAVVGAAAAAVAIMLATGRGGGVSAPPASRGEVAQVQQQVRDLREQLGAVEQALAARPTLSPADPARPTLSSADPARPTEPASPTEPRPAEPRPTEPGPETNPESLPGLAPARGPAPRAPQQQTPARTSQGSGSGCDADALLEKGKQHFAEGQLAAAFAALEASYACRPDPHTAAKAFVAACNLPSIAKAAWGWRRMSPPQRQMALAVCVRNGITEDDLDRAAFPQGTTRKP